MMDSSQLDLWQAEVDALPWGGQSPWQLAKASVHAKLLTFVRTTGGVDNSIVCCPSREALRIGTDPAQYQLCVSTSFKRS